MSPADISGLHSSRWNPMAVSWLLALGPSCAADPPGEVPPPVPEPAEETACWLAGPHGPSSSFAVDDDIRVEVDGVVVHDDRNEEADLRHPPVPVPCAASSPPAQPHVLRVVVTDEQACERGIDRLTLYVHGKAEQLVVSTWLDGCDPGSEYDADALPVAFVDVQATF
jgi:hypothetical protein